MKINDITSTPEIFVLIGLPGSGKSTWVMKFLASTDKPFIIASTDAVLERIAKENNASYNETFNTHYKNAEREMKEAVANAFKNGISLIWDQTNLNDNKRRKILSQVPKNYRKIAVVFKLNDDELYKRLNKRAEETGKIISPNIIEQMKKTEVPVSKSEGFNQIIEVNG